MNTTQNLQLPYIAAAQAQKHVTHNEALEVLDDLAQITILTRTLTSPPASPAEGDRHVPAAGAGGAWSGAEGRIASFRNGAWVFRTPKAGWRAWCAAEGRTLVHDGAGWIPDGVSSLNPVPLLGVATTADATNRLSVASPASLFTHAGSDHRMVLNKDAAASTCSLQFHSAYSGRAEIGLAGSNAFSIKVSADGALWRDALTVNGATGAVSLPNSPQPVAVAYTGSASDLTAGTMAVERLPAAVARRDGPNTLAGRVIVNTPANGSSQAWSDGTHAADLYLGSGGVWFGSYTSSDLFLMTGNGASRLTVKVDGKVGVGTASPTTQLDVAGPIRMGSASVSALPPAGTVGAGALILVPDETGGAVVAFSDGSAWRRVTDRAIVS